MRGNKGIIWDLLTLSQRLNLPLRSDPEVLHLPHHIHLRYPDKPLSRKGLQGFCQKKKGRKKESHQRKKNNGNRRKIRTVRGASGLLRGRG